MSAIDQEMFGKSGADLRALIAAGAAAKAAGRKSRPAQGAIEVGRRAQSEQDRRAAKRAARRVAA